MKYKIQFLSDYSGWTDVGCEFQSDNYDELKEALDKRAAVGLFQYRIVEQEKS